MAFHRFVHAWLTILLTTSLILGNACCSPLDKRTGLVPSLNGAPVFFGGGTYPRATRLANGALLGTFTSYSSGQNIINTCLSTNGGASWTQLGVVTSGVGDIDNPYLLQLPTGRILCSFRNHSKDPNNGAYTYFRITVCYSDDNGASWRYLSQPVGNPAPGISR